MYGLNFFITVLDRMLCVHLDYLTSHIFFMCTLGNCVSSDVIFGGHDDVL